MIQFSTLKQLAQEKFPDVYKRLQYLRWMPTRLLDRIVQSDYRLHAFRAQLTNYRQERERVEKEIGYYPSLKNPQTFNEKILWKKAHVRDPLLTRTTDKYEVRQYVEEKLGEKKAKELLIPLLHVTDNPNDLPLDTLEPPFVVKTNHGSSFNLFIHDRMTDGQFLVSYEKSKPAIWDSDQIVVQLKNWLDRTYGLRRHEWAYVNIVPLILVEPFIQDDFGDRLTEVKVHCFQGRPLYFQIAVSLDSVPYISFLDSESKPIDVKYVGHSNIPPPTLDEITTGTDFCRIARMAGLLSQAFSYARIDFYYSGRHLFFSEITHYPHSGALTFDGSRDLDLEFGNKYIL